MVAFTVTHKSSCSNTVEYILILLWKAIYLLLHYYIQQEEPNIIGQLSVTKRSRRRSLPVVPPLGAVRGAGVAAGAPGAGAPHLRP